jgi:hypothetical protein
VAIRDGSAGCGACRTVTTLFGVGVEHHHGVYLVPEDDLDKIIWVVFANPQAQTQIERFFAPGNMPSLFGKSVHCECTGIRYTVGDTVIFRIVQARLFAR